VVYFGVIWYIFPILECCAEKNLATLFVGLDQLFSGDCIFMTQTNVGANGQGDEVVKKQGDQMLFEKNCPVALKARQNRSQNHILYI
jgi:hypothetical protein